MPELLLEFGPHNGRYKPEPGALWRASSFDPVTQKRPAGSGDTPWEAIAWWVVSTVEATLGLLVMARNLSDTPASVLARLSTMPKVKVITGPGAIVNAVERAELLADFIDKPVDLYDHATFFTPPSAATRRARTKRKKTK